MLCLQYQHVSYYLYLQTYIGEVSLDSILQYGVLVELTWAVLRPLRDSLPRGTLVGISLALIALGAATWPFSDARGFLGFPPQWHFLARLQQSIAILRILFFMALAAGSHVLTIGWRDRELQVATGLGSFSLVSLAGSIIHSHQRLGLNYHVVDVIVAASYVGTLSYWLISFAREEAPRREFTPQMRSLLFALAGTASAQRAFLLSSAGPGVKRSARQ
jgi:hypothetical protein